MTNSATRFRWQPIALGAVVLGLLVAGFGGAGGAAGATATVSKVKTVDIVSFAFRPATLTIAKGSKVAFSNTSTATHTATRDGAFDTGLIRPDKSVTVRFKQKGTFAYHCEIHPSMRGKIVVN